MARTMTSASRFPRAIVFLGLVFVSCVLLVTGLPPLPGFIAKFALLSTAIATAPAAGLGPAAWTLATVVLLSGFAGVVALTRVGIRLFWTVDRKDDAALARARGRARRVSRRAVRRARHGREPHHALPRVMPRRRCTSRRSTSATCWRRTPQLGGARREVSCAGAARRVPPVLDGALLALWLLLNQTLSLGHVLLGLVLSIALAWASGALRPVQPRLRRVDRALRAARLRVARTSCDRTSASRASCSAWPAAGKCAPGS